MNHQEWRRLSFQLAADLQTLHLESRRADLPAFAQEALELRARVEGRRFTVAVVGDFRRGKSTFINALLGRAILPSDVAPTTATVNRVTYGSKPAVELRYRDGRPPEIAPFERLADFVTKLSDEAADRAATIREAVITYPVRLCRNDVDLLDTPGLGDEATMTAVTLRELANVDAAILVIMADSPFSDTEGQFLDRLYAEGVTEVLFVVSALDRIRRPADRERVVESVRERVAQRIQQIADARFADQGERERFLAQRGSPRVFGVSALEALEYREEGRPDTAAALEATGIPAFEAALEQFLTAADEVGLRRRLEQALALCRSIQQDAVPEPVDDAAEKELRRLVALVHALEPLAEARRRWASDAASRVQSALQALLAPKLLPRIAHGVTVELECSLSAHWPDHFSTFCNEMGAKLEAAARRSVMPFEPDVRRCLEKEFGSLEEEERVRGAFAVFLEHVEASLRKLGHAPALPLWPAPATGDLPAFDLTGVGVALAPSSEAFRATLADPAVETSLRQAAQRSTFDALLSLEFGGLDGKWVSVATPRVKAVCNGHWERTQPGAVLAHQVEVLERALLARVDPLTQALRLALHEIATCRERAAVLRERRSYDNAASRQVVEELTRRLHTASARLDSASDTGLWSADQPRAS